MSCYNKFHPNVSPSYLHQSGQLVRKNVTSHIGATNQQYLADKRHSFTLIYIDTETQR